MFRIALNIFNKRPNRQNNIENQHLGKCRVRYFVDRATLPSGMPLFTFMAYQSQNVNNGMPDDRVARSRYFGLNVVLPIQSGNLIEFFFMI